MLQVSSIKSGLWDSMYDTFQTVGQHKLTGSLMDNCPEYVSIDVGPSIKDEKSTKDAPVIPEVIAEHKQSESCWLFISFEGIRFYQINKICLQLVYKN